MNLESLRSLPRRLARAEEGLSHILTAARDARDAAQSALGRLEVRAGDVEPTYIYVLPPVGAFMAQRAYVKRGFEQQLHFECYEALPPGIWVIAVGPAIVRDVRLGNMSQVSMGDFQGHICQTRETWTPGTRLIVGLGA